MFTRNELMSRSGGGPSAFSEVDRENDTSFSFFQWDLDSLILRLNFLLEKEPIASPHFELVGTCGQILENELTLLV
jgi:hypothetical protein